MYKQVIVIRKDLKMRLGKCVAQGAHASMGAILSKGTPCYLDSEQISVSIPYDENIGPWLSGTFTKICVSVDSLEELEQIFNSPLAAEIPKCLITDSGKTEFNNVPTKTCCAIGPADSKLIDKITGHLKLL